MKSIDKRKFSFFRPLEQGEMMPSRYAAYDMDYMRFSVWACPMWFAPVMRLVTRVKNLYWAWAWRSPELPKKFMDALDSREKVGYHRGYRSGHIDGHREGEDDMFRKLFTLAGADPTTVYRAEPGSEEVMGVTHGDSY